MRINPIPGFVFPYKQEYARDKPHYFDVSPCRTAILVSSATLWTPSLSMMRLR